ncbi:hypothetical protein K402DRAFT_420421 [Aulographum hederae CBS 113979]|uniref:Blastomyces yeast-phase-specific protein n=1 Tax=Aulographum hederae CBS 113979 TaxID=1176131 RepID=A0A6G1H2J3_9PEZI|nr:hypothetical protein K402DRAFT_420421 [Aulographum hederae CBS 113979]
MSSLISKIAIPLTTLSSLIPLIQASPLPIPLLRVPRTALGTNTIKNNCPYPLYVRHEWDDRRMPDYVYTVPSNPSAPWSAPQHYSAYREDGSRQGGGSIKIAKTRADLEGVGQVYQLEYTVNERGLTYDLSHVDGSPFVGDWRKLKSDSDMCRVLENPPWVEANEWPDQVTECPGGNLVLELCQD